MRPNDSILATATLMSDSSALLHALFVDTARANTSQPSPFDAFAYRQILRVSRGPWHVIDAAASSAGAFALLAGAESNVATVHCDHASPLLAKALTRLGQQLAATPPPNDLNVLIVLDDPAALLPTLAQWPIATIVLHPIGKIGACSALAALIQHTTAHPEWRLHAVREVDPLCGQSRLALMSTHPEIPRALSSLGQLFHGNFQFADALAQLIETVNTVKERDAQIVKLTADLAWIGAELASCRVDLQAALARIPPPAPPPPPPPPTMLQRVHRRLLPADTLHGRAARGVANAVRAIVPTLSEAR